MAYNPLNANGQATMANSSPVVLASDQSAVPVTSNAGSANIVIDTNNTTTSVLAAGATYTGTATDILAYSQVVVSIFGRPGVVAGDGSSAKASFYFEFSKDGTNWDTSVPHLIRDPSLVIPVPVINVHRYFRVKYVNDGGVAAIAALGLSDTAGTPTLQTVFRLTTYLHPNATKELTRTIDQSISGSDPAGLVISTGLGKRPDGQLIKEKADGVATTTSATLAGGAVYTSSWIDTDGWREIEVFLKSDVVSATDGVEIQFTDDVTGTPTVRGSVYRTFGTADVTTGSLTIRIAPRMRGYRIKYTNGASAQASFFLITTLHAETTSLPQANIETALSPSNVSVMVRSINTGRSPDGTYLNIPAKGRSASNNTTSTLLANAVYTGTFETTNGHVAVSAMINADQASAAEGVEIQHSDDGTNVRFSDKFAYGTSEVTNGYGYYTVPARAEYVRIKYTNGGTNQGSFRIRTYLSPTSFDNIETTVEAPISSSNTTEIGRSLVLSKNAAGVYGNVGRGTSGGLNVGIVQHEVDTPIKALTSSSGSQVSVLTSATQLDTSQLSGRKGIVVKALNSNNQKIYVGFSSGVTTGNGYELDAGQFVEMDLSTDKQIWAIANSSTQTACVIQVA